MIGGIIGDVIGSVYEAHQWTSKDLPLIQNLPVDKTINVPVFKDTKWVRTSYGWTDDTLCTLGLYKAYIEKTDFATTLQDVCVRNLNESIGFGKSFKNWLNDMKPYNSYANGCIMRIGFIPFLPLSLSKKLTLGHEVTKISHNHLNSYQAVQDYITLCHALKEDRSKEILKTYLKNQEFEFDVQKMHEDNRFELNSVYTLCQAVAIVYESKNFEEVLRNTFYVGGDSDTLATIACNIASIIYPIPSELMQTAQLAMSTNQELYDLVIHFSENYWEKF